MSENLKKIAGSLTSAISKTMESMTFEEIEVIEHPPKVLPVSEEKMWASVSVIRPVAGEIVVVVPAGYGKVLTQEVAGTHDEEVSSAAVNDVLGEVVNTIAGRFVGDLVPSTEEFELGLPKTGRGEPNISEKEATSILLNIGGHNVKTTVFGDGFLNFSPCSQGN